MTSLKVIDVRIYFPADMAVGADRARWYIEGAVRGWWQQFATNADPIRQMRNATVVFPVAPPSAHLGSKKNDRGRDDLALLKSETDRLREALEPFARIADQYDADDDGGYIGDKFPGSEVLYGRRRPDLGDFRKARSVLSSTGVKSAETEGY